jgi:aminodeoxyfutalosine deaminase
MAFSLRARVVYPVDRPPLEHGVVTIEGERIVALGTEASDANVIDLGDVALLPGLVNAHTHLEFSYLQRPLGHAGMPLVDWIRLVIQERGRADYQPEDAIRTGLEESLQCGVTTIGDIAAGDSIPVNTPVDITVFAEVIAFSRARADSAFASVQQRLDHHIQNADGNAIGISPHAPYTVSAVLVSRLIAMAQQQNLPVAMHLAESIDELQFLAEGTGAFRELLEERSMWDSEAVPTGSRPLDYLRLLAEVPRALVIHGNYLDDEDIAFLGAHAECMSLVFCPRTHSYFGHDPYPLAKLLNAGVSMAIGTDSRASNPDLGLLSEMRHVARTHPSTKPHAILKMGTLVGAHALGRADEAGSITPKKLANLVAIPLSVEPHSTATDILDTMLHDHTAPSIVWLHGRKVD